MPIYEYRCARCHRQFERIIMSGEEAVSCPGCASVEVEKQLSVFSLPGPAASSEGAGGGCGCTPQTCGCR